MKKNNFSIEKQNMNMQNYYNNKLNQQPRVVHPSQESSQPSYKPTIKVNYKIDENKQIQNRRYRKPVIVPSRKIENQEHGVKKIATNLHQALSGIFLQSQYIPKHSQRTAAQYHKKNVQEAHQKYRSGKQIEREMKSQFIDRCRSSRSISTLPTHDRSKNSGYHNSSEMREIMEYRNAGNYRCDRLSQKCNNQNARSRFVSFSQLHSVDFRKIKQMK